MDKNEFENIFYKIENFTIVKQALLAFRAIGGIVDYIFKYNKVPEYAVKHFNINNKNLYCMTYVGYHHTLVGLCQKLWNEEL